MHFRRLLTTVGLLTTAILAADPTKKEQNLTHVDLFPRHDDIDFNLQGEKTPYNKGTCTGTFDIEGDVRNGNCKAVFLSRKQEKFPTSFRFTGEIRNYKPWEGKFLGDDILENFRSFGFKGYVNDEGDEVHLALFVHQGVVELHGCRQETTTTKNLTEEGIFREESSTGLTSTLSLWNGFKTGSKISIGNDLFTGRIKFAAGKPTDGEGTLEIKGRNGKLSSTFKGYLRDGKPWNGTLEMPDGTIFQYKDGKKFSANIM